MIFFNKKINKFIKICNLTKKNFYQRYIFGCNYKILEPISSVAYDTMIIVLSFTIRFYMTALSNLSN